MQSHILFISAVLIVSACKPRPSTNSFAKGSSQQNLDTFSNGGRDGHIMNGHETHWGYSSQNQEGQQNYLPPPKWGTQYEECASGRSQSPIFINIPEQLPNRPMDQSGLFFDWPTEASPFNVLNNRHTVQANVDDSMSLTHYVRFRHKKYQLKQFHYHKLSEHVLVSKRDSVVMQKRYPLEVHFVHQNVEAPHDFLVIGVLGERSDKESSKFSGELVKLGKYKSRTEDDRYRQQALEMAPRLMLPESDGETAREFTFKGTFATYMGSLTTPPCTEGVTWIVLLNPVFFSQNDITTIQKARFDNEFNNSREPAFTPSSHHNLEIRNQ